VCSTTLTLVGRAQDQLAAYDTALRCIHVSDAVARCGFGRRPDELIGHTLCEVAPDVALKLEPLLRHVLETDEPLVNVDLSGETTSTPGAPRHWLGTIYPLRNPAGRTIGVGAMAADLPEHKPADDKHADLLARERLAEQRLAFMAEASQLIDSSIDCQTVARRVAHLAVPFLGEWCAVHTLQGARVRLVARARAHATDQGDADALLSGSPSNVRDLPPAVAHVLRTGASRLLPDATDGQLAALLGDANQGRSVPALGRQSCMVVALRVRGRTLGSMAFGASDRHYGPEDLALAEDLARCCAQALDNARRHSQADRRLRELEALHRADEALHQSLRLDEVLQALVGVATDILEADKSLVLVWDAKHQRLVVGAARGFAAEAIPLLVFAPGEGISGRAAEQGEPIVVHDLLSDTRLPPHLRAVANAEAMRSLASVPIKESDDVIGVFNVIFLVPRVFSAADRRMLLALAQRAALAIGNARLYERAQRAVHAREEVLAATSHELRNPLGNIKGFVSALQRTDVDWDQPTRRDFLGEIEREADRLEKLVDGLLDLAHIDDTGVDDRTRAPVRPKALVAAGLDRVRHMLAGRDVFVSIPHQLPPVEVDAGHVEHVLANLLENAAKYAPSRTPIHVSGRVVGDEVELAVDDEGPGIATEHLERIFDRFFRARVTDNIPGTGLGLAICRSIVQAQGGSIWAENRASGGARFVVRLPVPKRSRLLDAAP
jgi:signal transduction histidine kinase